MNSRTSQAVRLATFASFAAGAGFLVAALPIGEMLDLLRGRIEDLGVWAPLAYALLYAAAATLFVPGSALSLGAGLLFGIWLGTAVVWLGATAAIALSFLIARYAARARVEQWAQTRPRFAAVDKAIGEQGWKIVALMRLSPVFPFSLQNYLYGITAIRFLPCVIASAAFIVPGTFLYVYLGFAGGEAAAAAGSGAGTDTLRLALQIAGLLATAAVTVGIARIASKAIASHAPSGPERSKAAEPPTAPANPSQSLLILAVAIVFLIAAAIVHQRSDTLLGDAAQGPPALTASAPAHPSGGILPQAEACT